MRPTDATPSTLVFAQAQTPRSADTLSFTYGRKDPPFIHHQQAIPCCRCALVSRVPTLFSCSEPLGSPGRGALDRTADCRRGPAEPFRSADVAYPCHAVRLRACGNRGLHADVDSGLDRK